MKRIFVITALLLALSSFVLSQTKPNLSGTWKLQSTEAFEMLKIAHKEPDLHLVYEIEDNVCKRTLDLKVMTDGKEHKQEVQGLPATLIAKWEGEALILEIKRQAPFGVVHNRRTMKLSKDGMTITAERSNFSPEAEELSRSTEVWQKQ